VRIGSGALGFSSATDQTFATRKRGALTRRNPRTGGTIKAEKFGIETTTYVRNIYKYYAAYRLMLEVQEAQKKARESVKQGG